MADVKKVVVCPPEMSDRYGTYHFAPAIRVGDTVRVSGQVGTTRSGDPGVGMECQARLAFGNLATVLEQAGSSMADVVELMTFHTHFHRDMVEFMKVKDEFLTEDFPAWTAIGVTELARQEYLVEIRAVAVIGCAKP
jgi:enamine deaminase RidA (YjgF/YER057c/UK114 family)